MRKLVATAILLVSMAHISWAGSQELVVDSVKDGDTILASINGTQFQIQLLGIDAPEDVPNPKLLRDMKRTKLGQSDLIRIGKEATKHLAGMVAPGNIINVDADLAKKDRYGRVPAVVVGANGRNLNQAMVEDGYAIVMGSYPFDAALKEKLQNLQTKAITENRGLWKSNPRITKAWGGK